MIVLLVLLILILLYKCKYYREFNPDYISKYHTNSIKGIFAVIILLSHMKGYIALPLGWYNDTFCKIIGYIDQNMVALFLFYSGYGITASLKKNEKYLDDFFKKRFLKILLHFDIAVLIFIILMTSLGYRYNMMRYLTCWIGWESVGNSNWFVFAILLLYAIVMSFKLVSSKYKTDQRRLLIWFSIYNFIFTLLSYGLLRYFKPGETWWYNTLFCFPLGILFCLFKEKLESICKKMYNIITVCAISMFIIWHYMGG